MNKEELVNNLNQSRVDFLSAIEGLSNDAMIEPGVGGEWSIKEIMSHITAWEAELVKLLWQAGQGMKPTTKHFSGTPIDDLNDAWYRRDKDRPLELVTADFEGVRKQTVRRIRALSEEELGNVQRNSWNDGKAVWEWIAGDSFEHEQEHLRQIEKWREVA